MDDNKDIEKEVPKLIVPDSFESSGDSYESDNFDDDNSSDGMLTNSKYDIPDRKQSFLNTKDGSVVNKENLSQFEIIRAIAKESGTKIQNPLPGCTHCLGRGYEGLDAKTKMPLPCRCLFRGKTKVEQAAESQYDATNNNRKVPRSTKRRMKRMLMKNYKLQQKFLMGNFNEDGTPKNIVTEEQNTQEFETILKTYGELKSLKKTAQTLNMTQTKVNKIIEASKKRNIDVTNELKELE